MEQSGRDAVVRGLAALAVATAEAGGTEEQARLAFIPVLRAHATTDPALVREAAARVGELPQPADDDVDDPVTAQQIRGALGVPAPEDQLAAMLRGREWLLRFADALEA